ncbi:GTPase IMAP family member 8-like isoform X2 [Anabas testudineus]|uniref:GTPase IMAP family member 8-like isoform X2 n=1 Tax=Anabas testudineus TaxID=64144 RepID=UPI000E45E772|nr:GTPase IMAP family member 8-like isoform X2 [Anabas testudineus]
MAAVQGPDQSLSSVVLLLLGEKLSGKSSAGNAILGQQAFHNKTTRSSSKKNGTFSGKQVTVVDTPGWLTHCTTPDSVSQQLCRAFSLCHPDVILLVISATTTFGQVEWRAMQEQLRLLQTAIWQRAIVLFTHGDKLGGLPIQEHIKQQGPTLHWLLERCANRYQVMTSQSRTSQAQVAELFEQIQQMMEANSRPREIQYRMYTQLRLEVCMEQEERRQRRREKMEMTVMDYGKQVSSGWLNMPRGSPAAPVGFKPMLGLILLGRRKSGKSSAGNKILDREEFPTATKTVRCSAGNTMVSGWSVTVVDTPGWSLFGLANPQQVLSSIAQSLHLCPVGSKVAFLLAVPVDSFREKDRRALEKYLSALGNDVWRSSVVLFTYGEELKGKTVEKHIKEKGQPLQWVLDRCGQRHHVFHRNTGHEDEVTQLLEIVERL